ncbi:MAG: rhomboid family intramembrane serine protease [Lachnospiraceae bacterium]|nr:rhomboid family intramembrane serine protease [Lachnospiraceae bacterium]
MKKFKISYNSPVILTFVIVSLVAFLLNEFTDGWANTTLFSTYRSSFADPLTYVRMVLHVLGHSSWSHYCANMVMILIVGPLLEEKYGSVTLLEIMALTAVATALIHSAFFPGHAILGSSSVIFMFIMVSSFTENRKGTIPLTVLIAIFMYIGSEMLDGIIQQENVYQLSHITGGLVGSLFGWMIRR